MLIIIQQKIFAFFHNPLNIHKYITLLKLQARQQFPMKGQITTLLVFLLLQTLFCIHVQDQPRRTCPPGSFEMRNQCVKCRLGCRSCIDLLKCTSCSQGYQFNPILRACSVPGSQSLVSIGPQELASYYGHINSKKQGENHWLPSIVNLQRVIYSDPVIRLNWEVGISKSTDTLPNVTSYDLLDMVDAACKTPPNYNNAPFVGLPILSLFRQLMETENGRALFTNDKVNQALKLVFDDYRSMIQSKRSRLYLNQKSPDGWFSKEAWIKINYHEFICNTSALYYGFNSWNQLFLRRFKPGVRPIGAGSPASVAQKDIIVNACQSNPLSQPTQPQTNVKLADQFWLKDGLYSLADILGAVQMNKFGLAKQFEGGTVYQASLAPTYYHRWHAPVDGIIEDIYQIEGTYYFDQSQFEELYNHGASGPGEQFLATVAHRKVIIIKADNKRIGKIALVFVGMMEVSSCVHTVSIGDRVKKGDEIGHFEFGGSTHAIIFQKQAKLKFSKGLYQADENGNLKSVKHNVHTFLAQIL